MLIALLPILLIICAILLLSYLWERRKCLRMQKRLFRESRKLEHTNHIASAILKNVHAYILLIDNDFKVLKTNYYQLTGTQKGLEEKRVGDLLQCRNALSAEGGCGTHAYCGSCPIRCAIRQAFEQRRGFTDLEATLNVLTSEKKSVECDAVISGSYFLLNEEENMVLTVHDITQLKETEKQLTLAKEKAENADLSKSAFLANMSHEIRTPLNAITGFAEVLASANTEEEKAQYQEIIKMNADLLLQLVNDILDMSKIEAGTLEFQYSNVELNAVMKELESTLQLKMKSEAVKLEFVPPADRCLVHLEKNRVSQLIINLVTNAIKFTEKGSIRFGYELREKELYFYVADTGCGIAKDEQESIFGRFVKLNSFAQGTGLGLSICQTLVNHMGGHIGVESEKGKGSTFWFTLPYEAASTAEPVRKAVIQPIAVEKDKLTILIAEDNESNFRLFESILRQDYRLLHAWDGREAVEIFRKEDPQIILMDINMPVMDGYEATKEIRKYSAKVPIIAVTAFAYASDEQRVMESGFDGYMPKPINARQLQAQLKEIMQKRIILL